jgi:MGT family glycosyltransferase
MGRFLLSAMPFTGHVTPICAVAAALIERGHHVRVYTGAAFRDRIESVGARLVPWRNAPDFDENDLAATFPRLVGRKGLGQVLINVQDVFIDTVPAQISDLDDERDREPWDVVAGDDLSVGAALHAELRTTPWATICVLPLNLQGRQGPPSGLGLAPGTNPLTRLRDAALRAAVPLLARPLRAPLARARAAVGLPPSDLAFDRVVFSSRSTVASGVPALDYGRTDRPPTLRFVGRLALPAQAERVPDWWPDLDGRPVVHVTQGTQNTEPSDLIRPALDALADHDVLVVVATGTPGRDTLPFATPANARVAGFLPYSELLPRTDIVITNGGWGGTLAALAHGIPLVIAGGDLDKPEVAARVAWCGAGVNLKTGTPTAAQISRGFDRVMNDPSYRRAAAGVAAQLEASGGAPRAAELLENLL